MVAAVGLTDAKIRALKYPPEGQVEYPDTLVPGLRLRVGSSGAKTFILRKRVGGRARNLTIERYHERRFTLHMRYHDAEHAFAVLDTDIVSVRFKGWTRAAVAAELDPAFHAYNRMR